MHRSILVELILEKAFAGLRTGLSLVALSCSCMMLAPTDALAQAVQTVSMRCAKGNNIDEVTLDLIHRTWSEIVRGDTNGPGSIGGPWTGPITQIRDDSITWTFDSQPGMRVTDGPETWTLNRYTGTLSITGRDGGAPAIGSCVPLQKQF